MDGVLGIYSQGMGGVLYLGLLALSFDGLMDVLYYMSDRRVDSIVYHGLKLYTVL